MARRSISGVGYNLGVVGVLEVGRFSHLVDVRSPGEFAEDHIPGAVNLPAFSSAERAAVGTLYKSDAFAGRRYGAALFTANVARLLQGLLATMPPDWAPLVYCARGGQRSGGMVEVLRRIGWEAQQLEGGYKAYRQHVMRTIDETAGRVAWTVIAGKTGSGKTRLLGALAKAGARTVDLEGLANHRGSVFGGRDSLGQPLGQPSQRRFESLLAAALGGLSGGGAVFVEAESRKIGALHVPSALLAAMRAAPVVRLEACLEARARFIADEYAAFCRDRGRFEEAVWRLEAFAGAKQVRRWLDLHAAGEWVGLAESLLRDFYDVGYEKSLRVNYGSCGGRVFEVEPGGDLGGVVRGVLGG